MKELRELLEQRATRRIFLRSAAVVGGATAVGIAVARGASADTATFPAVADTYVDQNAPASNFGTNQRLLAAAGNRPKWALVRFDVAGIPAGAAVSAAVVLLTTRQGMTKTVELHQLAAGQSFGELTTTWNNRPTIDPAVLSSVCCKATNTQISLPAGNVAGNGSWYYALLMASGNGEFASREDSVSAARPALQVTWSSATTTTAAATTTTLAGGEGDTFRATYGSA